MGRGDGDDRGEEEKEMVNRKRRDENDGGEEIMEIVDGMKRWERWRGRGDEKDAYEEEMGILN